MALITPTPTRTPEPTPFPTKTPTRTVTPSLTKTNTTTPTKSKTPTPTITKTLGITQSPTITPTPTPTQTKTVTPTITPEPSQFPTETPTRTVTPTNTPTRTITPTKTKSPTPTPTKTKSPTPTPTKTKTPTPSPTTIGYIVNTYGFQITGLTANTGSTLFLNSNNIPLTSVTNNSLVIKFSYLNFYGENKFNSYSEFSGLNNIYIKIEQGENYFIFRLTDSTVLEIDSQNNNFIIDGFKNPNKLVLVKYNNPVFDSEQFSVVYFGVSLDTTDCITLVDTVPAIAPVDTRLKATFLVENFVYGYSSQPAQFYLTNGFISNGTGTAAQVLYTPGIWRQIDTDNPINVTVPGPLFRVGVSYEKIPASGITWTNLIGCDWYGFSECLTVETGKYYFIGSSADNNLRIYVDGQIIVDTSELSFCQGCNIPLTATSLGWESWKVYQVYLSSGQHAIQVVAQNCGPKRTSLGWEIYDNTLNELIGAQNLEDLNRIFSTETYRDQSYDNQNVYFDVVISNTSGNYINKGYTCPTGYTYACGNCYKYQSVPCPTVTPTRTQTPTKTPTVTTTRTQTPTVTPTRTKTPTITQNNCVCFDIQGTSAPISGSCYVCPSGIINNKPWYLLGNAGACGHPYIFRVVWSNTNNRWEAIQGQGQNERVVLYLNNPSYYPISNNQYPWVINVPSSFALYDYPFNSKLGSCNQIEGGSNMESELINKPITGITQGTSSILSGSGLAVLEILNKEVKIIGSVISLSGTPKLSDIISFSAKTKKTFTIYQDTSYVVFNISGTRVFSIDEKSELFIFDGTVYTDDITIVDSGNTQFISGQSVYFGFDTYSTYSIYPTPTPTKTPTKTPTRTVTPSLTKTKTPTPTRTPQPTSFPTKTPTRTKTPTKSPTPTRKN